MLRPDDSLILRELGRRDYEPVWRAMQAFTEARREAAVHGAVPDGSRGEIRDELWLVEHPPVYTLGLNGKREHLLAPGEIPVIPVDRGGQVTYHGPGQVVAYLLLDLNRRGLGVRELVEHIEQAVIALLAGYGIAARARRDAPGVYVGEAKIAALGLRVRRGYSYHGLSLNVAMDLAPFHRINPCGHAGMAVTQLADAGGPADPARVTADLVPHLSARLGYNAVLTQAAPEAWLAAAGPAAEQHTTTRGATAGRA